MNVSSVYVVQIKLKNDWVDYEMCYVSSPDYPKYALQRYLKQSPNDTFRVIKRTTTITEEVVA